MGSLEHALKGSEAPLSTEEAELVEDVLNDPESLALFSLSLPGASEEKVEEAVKAWARDYARRQSAAGLGNTQGSDVAASVRQACAAASAD